MFKNYFKIAWRNLQRNKMYSFINIAGLAIGLAVCMLIVLYVGHESSYDQFHKNADRIVWIQGKIKMGNDSMFVARMSYATAPAAKRSLPYINDYVRLFKDYKNPVIENPQSPSLKFSENNFVFADSNFFSFFSFTLSEGNNTKVLQNPFSVVISRQVAAKYFGSSNPIGKIIRYNNDYTFTITGIAEKTPSNSSINYDFVAALSSLTAIAETKKMVSAEQQTVQMGSFSTYLLLDHAQDAARLETGLHQLSRAGNKDSEDNERYIASPLTGSHINYSDGANTKYLRIFPFIAAFVLLLALVNYISLSTARSAIRAKEIGVRKVMGADRKSIATQFFIESALYTAISFIIAYFLCTAFQPMFFDFLQIDIDKSFLYNPVMLLLFALLFIITVLIAATYPSLLLSAYKPVVVLYGKFSKKSGGISTRKFFTVFQFAISILLIIYGIVIDRQIYFFRHANTGVDRDNVVMIPFASSIGKHYNAFKKEVASLSSILQTSTARYPMYKGYDIFFAKAKNSNTDVSLPILSVDKNFVSLLGLKWKEMPADSLFYMADNTALLNETAAEKLNLGNHPIAETFPMGDKPYHVAGVLKDFNYQSLQNKIGALCLFVSKDNDTASAWGEAGGCFFAKIKPLANTAQVIQQVKTVYDKYDHAKPFDYYFMDDSFDAMYKAEDRLAKIFSVFTAFTLLIACLGLFGLSTFVALQRTKEVGIRKVLGASVSQVTALLSKDFLKLVLIAIVIAVPVGWWAMNNWLQAFAYRIDISWWMFVLAAAMAILIALLTVSYQAIKAAIANPVKSLRTE